MSDPSAEAHSVDTFISDSTKRDLVKSVLKSFTSFDAFCLGGLVLYFVSFRLLVCTYI